MKKIIAPSILSADFANLAQEIKLVDQAGADWIHVDVMDGHFVPNLTIGPVVLTAIRKTTKLPLDVHLMITNADQYLAEYAEAGADILTVHQEACPHLHRTIAYIKSLKKRAGVSINPATPIETLSEILPEVDVVLIMSVNPGFGGQKFIKATLKKIKKLQQIRQKNNYSFMIEVDGGVNEENIKTLAEVGCDAFVAGSAIFKTPNYKTTIKKLRKNIQS